jgi:hypothetical protein
MCTTHQVADLGYQIADGGLAAHELSLQRLAQRVGHLVPAAAAVLVDTTAPDVLRHRAFAVVASRCAG